ncbi:flagellar radial spoke protein, putative [Leishmania tarentolae]|uniref:Flagellar radial spoke protein, putative n=1 Tax=Leishmania tarentolae TaxID=5689 RepID=A0A640KS14_LEITA|nr:flagellar radial spoke protein, putative [Leishmania tarentolae]
MRPPLLARLRPHGVGDVGVAGGDQGDVRVGSPARVCKGVNGGRGASGGPWISVNIAFHRGHSAAGDELIRSRGESVHRVGGPLTDHLREHLSHVSPERRLANLVLVYA